MGARILLSAVESANFLGVSERLFHDIRHRPGFPRPVQLSPRCVRWRLDELQEWIRALPRHNAQPEPAQLREKRNAAGRAVST